MTGESPSVDYLNIDVIFLVLFFTGVVSVCSHSGSYLPEAGGVLSVTIEFREYLDKSTESSIPGPRGKYQRLH